MKWWPPLVLYRSTLSLVKSASRYPSNPYSFYFFMHKPRLGVPFKYLNMCLTTNRLTSLGSFWNLAQRHKLNIMLGLDIVTYERDPIIPLNVFSFAFFDSLLSPSIVVGCIGVLICFASTSLNFFRSSFTYLVWCMYMPSSACLICSPRKNFNSPIILILDAACISFEKSLYKESLVAPNIISSIYIWMIRNWFP